MGAKEEGREAARSETSFRIRVETREAGGIHQGRALRQAKGEHCVITQNIHAYIVDKSKTDSRCSER